MKGVDFADVFFTEQRRTQKRTLADFLCGLKDKIDIAIYSLLLQTQAKAGQNGAVAIVPAKVMGAAVCARYGVIIGPKGDGRKGCGAFFIRIKLGAAVYYFQRMRMGAEKLHQKLLGLCFVQGQFRRMVQLFSKLYGLRQNLIHRHRQIPP